MIPDQVTIDQHVILVHMKRELDTKTQHTSFQAGLAVLKEFGREYTHRVVHQRYERQARHNHHRLKARKLKPIGDLVRKDIELISLFGNSRASSVCHVLAENKNVHNRIHPSKRIIRKRENK